MKFDENMVFINFHQTSSKKQGFEKIRTLMEFDEN